MSATEPVILTKTTEPSLTLVPPAPAAERPSAAARARRRLETVATDERVLTAGHVAARHTMYLVGGTRIVTRRAWDGRTAARYERMMRAAEAAGQMEQAGEWEERGRAFRAARHQRRMELLTAPQKFAKGALVSAATVEGALLGIGTATAIAEGDVSWVLAPTELVIDLVHWAFIIGTLVWGPLMMALPAICLLSLWGVGRHQKAAPQWALPANQRDTGGDPITPSIVVTALRDLGVSTLRKAITEMGDAGAAMLSPIVLAGCGVEVDVTLPSGVSTQEVQAKRRKLAENLGRHEHEVFITIPQAARTVRLWIADSGALDEPIGPSPLVTDPGTSAEYKSGRAPWGQDLRGDAAAISLYQRHLLITGLSNQGKTAALRALALWLAFDVKVRFYIGDLKGIGDWEPMRDIAEALIQGPTDDHVIEVTEMVEWGVREMERRLLAPKGTQFDPIVLIVDEAQVAFMCPARTEFFTDEGEVKYGAPYGGTKATSRYFMAARKIHNQGRAVNVTLWQGTQDPTDQNLPKLVREGAHIRASLVVGTESQARMALGDKAVDGGAAPHKLRQGLDQGTLVVAGDGVKIPAGEPSITIRTHYVTDEEAVEVADRARKLRSGIATVTKLAAVEDADHLSDIAAALGDAPRMRTQEVLIGLAQRNPGEYREWTFSDLRQVLDEVDATPHKSDGQMVVDRFKVVRALADRASDDQGGAREEGSSP